MENETLIQKLGMWIMIIGIPLPSLVVGGFFADFDVLPQWSWVAISAGAGGLGMFLYTRPRLAALIGGLIGGAIVPIATIYYVMLRIGISDTFWSIEFVIPGAVGLAVGFGAYAALCKAMGAEIGGETDPETVDVGTDSDFH